MPDSEISMNGQENLEELEKDKFQEIVLQLPKDDALGVEQFFMQSGAAGYYELLYKEGETDNLNEDLTTLYFFYDIQFPLEAFAPMALALLGLSEVSYSIAPVNYRDYVKIFEETFRAFPLSEQTWLVPPWDNPPLADGVKKIILKPGLAFGTGQHATSRLMIRYLEKAIQPGDIVFDLGTGTGILAIAAALYGASQIQGVDAEKLAVESARDNYSLNDNLPAADFQFGDFSFVDSESIVPYTVFVSNILPKVFMANRANLTRFLEKADRWALSGITMETLDEFRAFLRDITADPLKEEAEDGWVILYKA